MTRKEHKKHHYIPQCYLRNFANDKGKSIYTYDKISSKQYNAAIDNICCVDDLYRLSEIVLKENSTNPKDALIIECEYFANSVEPEYKQTIDKLVTIKDRWLSGDKTAIIDFDFKVKLAMFIAIQYLRLPHIKDESVETYKYLTEESDKIIKGFVANQTNNPQIMDLEFNYQYDEAAIHAQTSFMSEELLNEFTAALAHNYWEFSISESKGFYTSDFPIVVEPHIQDVRPINLGLTQYGAELTFPITKDILVTIWDREYFSDKSTTDCLFTIANEKDVRKQNWRRYLYAKRHFFGYLNDFRIIEVALMTNGRKHIFMGNKRK